MVINGRGKHNSLVREQNEKRILDYLRTQETTTITECARALNLTPITVSKALKRLGVKRG